MFEKLRKFFEAKKEQHEYNYNVTFDNVAIPEFTLTNQISTKRKNLNTLR